MGYTCCHFCSEYWFWCGIELVLQVISSTRKTVCTRTVSSAIYCSGMMMHCSSPPGAEAASDGEEEDVLLERGVTHHDPDGAGCTALHAVCSNPYAWPALLTDSCILDRCETSRAATSPPPLRGANNSRAAVPTAPRSRVSAKLR